MKLPRRSVLRLAGGAVALPAVARLARAQSYPSRSVLILVGYAAGGPTDICARLIADWLSKKLDQQFVVENRDGAGSNIATEAAIARRARRLHAASGHLVERDQRHALSAI